MMYYNFSVIKNYIGEHVIKVASNFFLTLYTRLRAFYVLAL